MKRLFSLLILLLSLSVVLSACGGGGGGAAPGPTPSAPTPTPPSGTSSVKISGLVGSGAGAGGSSIAKAQTATENPLSNVIVTITAYDKNNKQTGSVTTATGPIGAFSTNIKLSEDGGYIIIDAKKDGFTSWHKRIDFKKPADVNIQAILDAVVDAIANTQTDVIFKASIGKNVIKFGLFKTAKGQKVIKVGRDVELRKQNGTPPVLEIEIPVNSIPQGTNTLIANLNTYDPITDASKFPGQYRDNKGNRIVSLGFDYINITDDTGTNLGALTTAAIRQGKLTKAQAAEPVYITRWIGSTSCTTLLKDFCTSTVSYDPLCNSLTSAEKAGFNVPVYTYNPNNGTWIMLGIGTIDKNGDGIIDNNDVIPNGTTQDYQNQCTNNNGEYLRILVSNEDFIKNWWNLDYPLIFEQPKEICIDKKFVDQNNNPIEGMWVELFDDDNTQSFSSAWGSTDSNGKVILSAVLTNSTTDEDLSGKISYYNPFDYSYQEESVTLGKSPNCTKLTNPPITKPPVCQVQGHLKDDTGAAIGDQFLYIYSSNPYYYNYGYTDNNGYFIIDARCTTDQDVYVGWNWQPSARFNPDNSTVGYPSESTDDGSLVTLYDIVIENQKPYAYCWLSSISIFAGNSITAYFYEGDNECDTPLEWKLKKDGAEVDSGSEGCWFYEERSLSFDTVGTYPVTLDVTDSKHRNDPTIADCGTVYVSGSGENRPPIISYAYTNNYYPAKNTEITLYGGASDIDGNDLSWQWYANGNPLTGTGCSGSNSYWIETECTYTTPDVNGQSIPIKFRVSDNSNAEDSWSFDIYVGGVPGSLDIIIQKKGKR